MISYVPQVQKCMNPRLRWLSSRFSTWPLRCPKNGSAGGLSDFSAISSWKRKAIAKQYPFTLSGGMRQRAHRHGVAADAEIIFGTNPLRTRRKRIDLVVLPRTERADVVCVTHDLSFAHRIASRVSVMYAANQMETADVTNYSPGRRIPIRDMT